MQSSEKSGVEVDASLQLAQQLKLIAARSIQAATTTTPQIQRFYPTAARFHCNKVADTQWRQGITGDLLWN